MLTRFIVCHLSRRPSCVCFSRTNYAKPPSLGVFIPLVFVFPGNVRMVLDEKAVVWLCTRLAPGRGPHVHSCTRDTKSALVLCSKTRSSGSSEQMWFLPELAKNPFSLAVFVGSGFCLRFCF